MNKQKMNKLSKHNFAIKYFNTYFHNNNYIHIETKEILNNNILNDFYDDFINTRLNFNQYKKETQIQF